MAHNSTSLKYLLESSRDLQWGLTISAAGNLLIEPNTSYPNWSLHPNKYLFLQEKGRILDEYQLIYISQGKGYFVSKNYKKTEIHAGNLFILFPGEWHSFGPERKSGWHEHWIGFKGLNIDQRCENGFFDKSTPVFNIGYNSEVITLYDNAIKTAQEQKAGYQQMLAGIVNYLLGLIYFLDRQSLFDELKIASRMDQAKLIMSNNFHLNISSYEIAESLCMSYSYFRKLFKEYTGYTPKRYLTGLKIEKSKELLTTTSLYLKEISLAVGIENVEHFCNLFKKNVKITPTAYRNKTQGKFK